MRIIPIMPIESMYGMVYQRAGYYIRRSSKGKINGSSPFYFKTVNGKTFVQRCPNRSTKAQNQHLCR